MRVFPLPTQKQRTSRLLRSNRPQHCSTFRRLCASPYCTLYGQSYAVEMAKSPKPPSTKADETFYFTAFSMCFRYSAQPSYYTPTSENTSLDILLHGWMLARASSSQRCNSWQRPSSSSSLLLLAALFFVLYDLDLPSKVVYLLVQSVRHWNSAS